MKPPDNSRLHELRMANDQRKYDMDEMRPRFETMRDRHTNGTAPQAVSAYQLFQTPATLAAHMATLLGVAAAGRILEPSAGLARLIDAVAPYRPTQIVAVESAAECAKFLFNNRTVQLLQRDFLTVSPEETGLFDGVIMNPPFHMRADVRHIQHARQFLKPGGTLVAICMDTHHRTDALRGIASTWQPLPARTFAEAATNVPTVLLTIHG